MPPNVCCLAHGERRSAANATGWSTPQRRRPRWSLTPAHASASARLAAWRPGRRRHGGGDAPDLQRIRRTLDRGRGGANLHAHVNAHLHVDSPDFCPGDTGSDADPDAFTQPFAHARTDSDSTADAFAQPDPDADATTDTDAGSGN